MNRNTIRADQRAIYMRRRAIHMIRKRLFPRGKQSGMVGGPDDIGARRSLPRRFFLRRRGKDRWETEVGVPERTRKQRIDARSANW